ncbi:STAS domain-containing protein [Streptosporangium sp. NPDC002544]|uniref:STAS domain-containing protein n=1 Tax=unclassified Streptosporangium TaxID=2632669 RepID=UPI00331C1B7F
MTILKTRASCGVGPQAVAPAATVIHLHGEIDVFTSAALRERLLRALRRGANPLILDLSGVSFFDTSGLAVLVGIQRRARSLGVTFELSAPRHQTADLLRVTGLDRTFTIR